MTYLDILKHDTKTKKKKTKCIRSRSKRQVLGCSVFASQPGVTTTAAHHGIITGKACHEGCWENFWKSQHRLLSFFQQPQPKRLVCLWRSPCLKLTLSWIKHNMSQDRLWPQNLRNRCSGSMSLMLLWWENKQQISSHCFLTVGLISSLRKDRAGEDGRGWESMMGDDG